MTRSEQLPIGSYAALCAAWTVLKATMAGLRREDPVDRALAVIIHGTRDIAGVEEAWR
jgi:hypothetical protein